MSQYLENSILVVCHDCAWEVTNNHRQLNVLWQEETYLRNLFRNILRNWVMRYFRMRECLGNWSWCLSSQHWWLWLFHIHGSWWLCNQWDVWDVFEPIQLFIMSLPFKRRIGWMIEHLRLKEGDIHSNIEPHVCWIIAPVTFLIGGIA